MPEILPEPDGGVGLEWSNAAGEAFAVILERDASLTFAGQFADGSRRRGTVHSPAAMPPEVLAILDAHFRDLQ